VFSVLRLRNRIQDGVAGFGCLELSAAFRSQLEIDAMFVDNVNQVGLRDSVAQHDLRWRVRLQCP